MTMAGTSLSPIFMVAAEDLAINRLVKVVSGTEFDVVYADAGDRSIGVTVAPADNNKDIPIELFTYGGTLKVVAAGTIAVGAEVYSANDGKVSDSVSGEPIGVLRKAGVSGEATELIPYGEQGGDTDHDFVIFDDDFFYIDLDESGSEGMWVLDANNGGALLMRDEQGGVIDFDASDTSAGDNDETYLVSVNEIYKPAAGKRMVLKARVKLTEAATDDANIVFGLVSDTIDVENLIVDNGATLQNSGTLMIISKSDGGTKWKGTVRDDALDEDSDIGAFVTNTWYDLMIVVSSASGATQLQVEFFVDGVSGGTKDFAVASATEMRLVFGVKNGGANNETLLIDRCRLSFER